MLQEALFAEELTEEDLTLARALLAERSPEEIAAALARLYRSRLPSPEDILDPGEDGGRARDERGRERDADETGRARNDLDTAGQVARPGRGRVTRMAKAASGSARRSAVRRMPKRDGCCR